mmetsp:Transcript_18959/g.32706  ORF Transcript_18959/g.32706 Transcript_18959/m.32706 type:complete len:105 (+) Transcript_18959:1-315(+)
MQCEIASDDAPEFERATFRGFVRGRQTVAKFNERAANELDVFLAVFRVPDVDADVLVTLCVPVRIAPDSSSAESATHIADETTNATTFAAMLGTLKVNDWSLFV